MKTLIITILAAAAPIFAMQAREIVDNVTVGSYDMERHGRYLQLDFEIGLDSLKVASNQRVLLTPRLVNGNDSVSLPAVAVYGRRRYYYYQRNYPGEIMSGAAAMTFMAKDKPASINYHELVDYRDWMDGATLTLQRTDEGCCRKQSLNRYGHIGRYNELFFPELVYLKPEGKLEKRRSLSGSAYIDFPVDQTVIYPDYRRNAIELARINHTIDTIRNDRDATIDSIWLKGYASPESPYAHNTELAIGRTEALTDYLRKLYRFDNVEMLTDYEPEDWKGLRKFVANSNLDNRDGIIELIDSDMEPDAKEAKIKRLYPDDYKFMFQQFYPALRHTDYRVCYVIRSYSDPVEILRIMKKTPQKLDQNEFYVAAGALEPGTDEFTEVFETAVKMFPDDPVANLNAANAAIRRDDFTTAERYLDNAGTSAEVLYARAAIAIRRKDYATARKYLTLAKDAGLAQAAATLDELNERTRH